jgi:hypothetical protein
METGDMGISLQKCIDLVYCEKTMEFHLSPDRDNLERDQLLRQSIPPQFQFNNWNVLYHKTFGLLDI